LEAGRASDPSSPGTSENLNFNQRQQCKSGNKVVGVLGISQETWCGLSVACRTLKINYPESSRLWLAIRNSLNVKTADGLHYLLEKDAEYSKDSSFGV
jgi:hypothetical protein